MVVFASAACTGPRPEVVSAQVIPPPPESPGSPHVVETGIRNASAGKGQVEVRLELKEKGSGKIYRQTAEVDLDGEETIHVTREFHVPKGDYEPEVKAVYPPP